MSDARIIVSSIDRSAHVVLVVDDNPATRYTTARVLTAAGFRTREAGSGGAALEEARQGVSAVILDVHLPDMSGFEVCRELRAGRDTRNLPVVHLSAEFTRDSDRVAGLEAGADAYLVHPVEPAILVATLQALIRARVAEEGLRRSELRLRAIYDNAPVGIVVLDARGVVLDANPAMLQLLGCAREDLLALPLAERAPPQWRDAATEQMTGHTHELGPWEGRFPLLRGDGSSVMIEWGMSGHVDPGLRIAIASDASVREQLESQRLEVLEREQVARAAAERHSRTKDDFIAVLSHELRTPLNAIIGWVTVLMRRQPPPDVVTKGLVAIERNVKAQARIISDILDVSRINSGKLTLEREVVDPAETVAAALGSLRHSIDEKKLELRVDLDRGHDPVWLDPSRYQQILWNLMTNAIKFSSPGAPIEVTVVRAHDTLRLQVRDFGQGIAPDFLDRLFDRFAQAQSPGNRVHTGLGLGLSIVRQLAELHGGNVTADSAGLGLGTTVTVDIPAPAHSQDMTDVDGVASAPAPLTGGDERPLDGLAILVVEDDPDASEMLSVVLADRGATVRLAGDFDSAVRSAQAVWPDVLLSDIGLPQRDGYELVQEFRRLQRAAGRAHLPAVALTAFARPEDRTRALDAGFDRHLAKPLNPHALVIAIGEAVHAARDDSRTRG
jgi:PAS domain S-box-containing protein